MFYIMAIQEKTAKAYQREIAGLMKRFEVEKNAKNKAYSFILESGLVEQFREYCNRGLFGSDPHNTCKEWIEGEARKRGIY